MHKNIKTAKKHKNTCFLNYYKKHFLHLWFKWTIESHTRSGTVCQGCRWYVEIALSYWCRQDGHLVTMWHWRWIVTHDQSVKWQTRHDAKRVDCLSREVRHVLRIQIQMQSTRSGSWTERMSPWTVFPQTDSALLLIVTIERWYWRTAEVSDDLGRAGMLAPGSTVSGIHWRMWKLSVKLTNNDTLTDAHAFDPVGT